MKPGAKVDRLQGKGFQQIISGGGAIHGGVARRFIGLIPSHTYRVSARLNIVEAAGSDWAFSFHASPNPPGGPQLSEGQMAGLAPLPGGSNGATAAQIARYDSSNSTIGQWTTRSSGVSGADNLAGDITLPPGADSITVWFRIQSGSAPEVTASLDSLMIEDLSGK
jgi:hypothetical protein